MSDAHGLVIRSVSLRPKRAVSQSLWARCSPTLCDSGKRKPPIQNRRTGSFPRPDCMAASRALALSWRSNTGGGEVGNSPGRRSLSFRLSQSTSFVGILLGHPNEDRCKDGSNNAAACRCRYNSGPLHACDQQGQTDRPESGDASHDEAEAGELTTRSRNQACMLQAVLGCTSGGQTAPATRRRQPTLP